jgi:thymidylate synthase
MLNPLHIEATTLNDAWFQTVYQCVEQGRIFHINEGSFAGQKRLEFDYVTIHIKYPEILPLLPKLNPLQNIPNPVAENYLDEYLPYLMTGEEKKGESYTYGSRLTKEVISNEVVHLLGNKIYKDIDFLDLKFEGKGSVFDEFGRLAAKNCFLNQMESIIKTYKNKGYRNNQMCMQVAKPSDMILIDPPCLRHIDTRIQDNKLHFFPYFRSWDLWSGFPANLAAIELMKQYCAEQIGVENGEIIAASKGLHIYDYVFELAEMVRGKSIKEFKKELKKT